jgi:hypothetical protein
VPDVKVVPSVGHVGVVSGIGETNVSVAIVRVDVLVANEVEVEVK